MLSFPQVMAHVRGTRGDECNLTNTFSLVIPQREEGVAPFYAHGLGNPANNPANNKQRNGRQTQYNEQRYLRSVRDSSRIQHDILSLIRAPTFEQVDDEVNRAAKKGR